MSAAELIAALRLKYAGAAILTEVGAWNGGPGGERRIDVLMFRALQRTAVEVKTTRADFRRESDDKRRVWRDITHRFVYLAPVGVIPADEVPDGCGLWEVATPTLIRVVRKARVNRNPQPLPEHVVQGFAYRAMRREQSPVTTSEHTHPTQHLEEHR